MNIMRTVVLMISSFFIFNLNLRANEPSLGVIGDSYSTGVFASKDLKLDYQELLKDYSSAKIAAFNLNGVAEDKPVRLWPVVSEYRGVLPWIYSHVMQSVSMLYLDDIKRSWVSVLSDRLGVESQNILVAAYNGASSYTASSQLDRLLVYNDRKLPSTVLSFFTVFDICSPSINFVTEASVFEKNLDMTLNKILNVKSQELAQGETENVSSNTTKVVMLPYLPLMQLPDTCDVLPTTQDQSISNVMSNVFPFNPQNYCASIYRRADSGSVSGITFLANRIREYRDRVRALVSKYQERAESDKLSLEFIYVDSLESISLDKMFLAKDCFHPSEDGHKLIAEKIYEAVK